MTSDLTQTNPLKRTYKSSIAVDINAFDGPEEEEDVEKEADDGQN